jgi:predicted TPR repeat methyltransferase
MEYKFFDTPKCHDSAFYNKRKAADHIYQVGSALRIYLAASYAMHTIQFNPKIKTVGDFGCGTGGMILTLNSLCNTFIPDRELKFYGYDLMPENIKVAKSRNLDANLLDFVNDKRRVWPDLLIMSEVIEHLIDPHSFVASIPAGTFCVFSVPSADDDKGHDPTHLWSWTETSFRDFCESRGVAVQRWDKMKEIHHVIVGVKR